MNSTCPLCDTKSSFFEEVQTRVYYKCSECKGIFMDSSQYMSFENEEKHYRFHNNDANDIGYQNFVSPITNRVLNDFTFKDSGLDFGAGTGSPITKVLRDNVYQIAEYDPYFHNNHELLKTKYNYIASCEVVEHFHHPNKEFALLKNLLLKGGKLYIMTHLYDPEIDFPSWYYIKDHTHVFLYQKETMEWIVNKFGFTSVEIKNRLIVFSN